MSALTGQAGQQPTPPPPPPPSHAQPEITADAPRAAAAASGGRKINLTDDMIKGIEAEMAAKNKKQPMQIPDADKLEANADLMSARKQAGARDAR